MHYEPKIARYKLLELPSFDPARTKKD